MTTMLEVTDDKQLTMQEMELVRMVLEDGVSKEEAARLVGIGGKTKAGRIVATNRVIDKYTQSASSRDILRASGVTEQLIASKLREILEHGTNTERLKAIDIATKCLGLQRDVDISGGAVVQINVSGARKADYVDGTRTSVDLVEGEICSIVT